MHCNSGKFGQLVVVRSQVLSSVLHFYYLLLYLIYILVLLK